MKNKMAIVTFETLREIQRREKKSEKLSELNDEFYSGAKEYFDRVAKSDLAELQNSRSIFDDIIDRREKKILNQALGTVRLGEKANTKPMTSLEKELFESLIESIKKFRETSDLEGRKIVLAAKSKKIGEDVEEEETDETGNYVKIKVLMDVPEIVGADMKDYGPFKKGEVVSLPKENADIFLEVGKAELV